MKKAIIVLILLTGMCGFATAQKDTSRLTVKYVYEDVKAGFAKLVDNLEGPAKHTYGVYVKQYMINGWSSLIVQITILICFIIFWRISFVRGKWKDGEPQNVWGGAQIFMGVAVFVAILVISINFPGNLQRIANPEYYAIDDIIRRLK